MSPTLHSSLAIREAHSVSLLLNIPFVTTICDNLQKLTYFIIIFQEHFIYEQVQTSVQTLGLCQIILAVISIIF